MKKEVLLRNNNAMLVFFFVFFLLLLCHSHTAYGALLYFDPNEATLSRGDTVTVALRLDTDTDECINAIDGVIEYGQNVKIVDVSRGNSILNLWIEEPTINEDDHTVMFAGGIPGGYCGRIAGDPSLTNIIVEIIVRSPGFTVGGSDDPNAVIRIRDESQALLNDGFGTPASLRTQEANITLLKTAGTAIDDTWTKRIADDISPPSDFAITLSRDANAFSNKWFITFNSQDKQSGIDHYEVMEEPIEELYSFSWGRVDAPWIVSQSPYVLNDQSLNSTIRVKAVDKAGNDTYAQYVPETALRSISNDRFVTLLIGAGILCVVVFILAYVIMRRKRSLIEAYDNAKN